jgi:hypothetical protein
MKTVVRSLFGTVLGLGIASVGLFSAKAPTYASPGSPNLSVQPTFGPVGSVVTVHASANCGQILFGPTGAVGGGSSLGTGSVIRFVIPAFVGVPATAVTSGRYAFGMSCGAGASGSSPNVVAPFVVTADALPTRFVGMAPTPNGGGYWLAQGNGGVESFGNANFFGSVPGLGVIPSAPIAGIAATPNGGGYWLVAADGGVFAFGNAVFHGSLPGIGVAPINPIVGISATADGGGYWLLGADGGVFAFGDAPYCAPVGLATTAATTGLHGPVVSVGSARYPGSVGFAIVDESGSGIVAPLPGQPCQPASNPNIDTGGLSTILPVGLISGIAVSPQAGHLWLVGNDGGVFAPQVFASQGQVPTVQALFYGSLPSLAIKPNAPIVAISASPDGGGYWLLGADGGVFGFGDATFHGSAAA